MDLIVSSETQCQRERTCWGIAGGEMREEEGGGTIPVPAGHPPSMGAVGKPVAKFPPFFFPTRTASAWVIEPCIISWMSSMSIPRLLDTSSTSDDSPPEADSVERERKTEGRRERETEATQGPRPE